MGNLKTAWQRYANWMNVTKTDEQSRLIIYYIIGTISFIVGIGFMFIESFNIIFAFAIAVIGFLLNVLAPIIAIGEPEWERRNQSKKDGFKFK